VQSITRIKIIMPRKKVIKPTRFNPQVAISGTGTERTLTVLVSVPEELFVLTEKFVKSKKIKGLEVQVQEAIESTLEAFEGAGIRYIEALETSVKENKKRDKKE
jgi:hypothetical protein